MYILQIQANNVCGRARVYFCTSTKEISVKAEGTVITPQKTCVFNANYEIYISENLNENVPEIRNPKHI